MNHVISSVVQEENSGILFSHNGDEEPTQADYERLGRERPSVFVSIYTEIGFVWSLVASVIMAVSNLFHLSFSSNMCPQEFFVSGFNIITPQLAVDLSIPVESRTWPASVFSLVTGSFLLPFARLGDIYGGYIVFNAGLVWYFIWSLIAGFSRNYLMLIFCRALQGFAPAAFLPTGIMMLGKVYRPGPRKNLVFGLYAAGAVLGFFVGIFVAGITAQLLSWQWYFWVGSILLFITSLISLFSLPRGNKTDSTENVKMDWLGFFTIVPGLILVVFAFTNGGHAPQSWATPYIYVTFILGFVLLSTAVYVQGWVSVQPLLSADLFKVKHMKLLTATLFLTYGVFGIYLFYASF
jgi:MFS family permease